MKELDALLMEALAPAGQDCPGNFDELFNRSIQINEAEFRRNYQENQRLLCGSVEYEACSLDFIPVADGEYVIADKNKRQLRGTFEAMPYVDNERAERTIDSALIAGCEDIREILSIVRQKRWSGVYILFNEAAQELASFFKLAEFPSIFPAGTRFFTNVEEMRRFFREDHDAYLPRKIFGAEPEPYEALVKELHEARIQDGIPSNNVFLSICIPTYNRGKLALESVRHALAMEFDAEVEMIVSDNASVKGASEYQKIAAMKDSRVRYLRAAENREFMGNIVKCLDVAKGHFALFYSDEDHVILENLRTAIEWLITRPADTGLCVFSGDGRLAIRYREEGTLAPGRASAVMESYFNSYVTGCCYNLDAIRSAGLYEKIHEFEAQGNNPAGLRERIHEFETQESNYLFVTHPHCAIGMWLSKQFKMLLSTIEIYHTEENEYMWDARSDLPFEYTTEARTLQSNAAIEIAKEWLSDKELKRLILYLAGKYFVDISYLYTQKDFCKVMKAEHRWIDIWAAQYQEWLKTLKSLEGKIDVTPSFMKDLDKVFLRWIVCVRKQRVSPLKENILAAVRGQMIRFYYGQGVPIEQIDLDKIEKDVEGMVEGFRLKEVDMTL